MTWLTGLLGAIFPPYGAYQAGQAILEQQQFYSQVLQSQTPGTPSPFTQNVEAVGDTALKIGVVLLAIYLLPKVVK